jgi:hypothetical protein
MSKVFYISNKLLADILDRSRIEYLSNTGTGLNDNSESEFDSLFILDRTVDLLTVMKTQMNYEGLVDELYTIKSSFVELDNTILANKIASSGSNSKTKKVLFNSTDAVLDQIRDLPFECIVVAYVVVGDLLNSIALKIKEEEESRHGMTTPAQLKDFASKLGMLQSKRLCLDTHEKIYRKMLLHASEPITKRIWKMEERIFIFIRNFGQIS